MIVWTHNLQYHFLHQHILGIHVNYLYAASRGRHFHTSLYTGHNKASLILTHATIKHYLYCVECSKMAHNKKYSIKMWISNGLVLRQNKTNFTHSDKVCETFWLGSQTWQALKTNHLSCGWLTSFWKTGSVLNVPHSGRQKTGRSAANSTQRFAERFKEVS